MDLCLRDNPHSILIVVPRVVLIQNWKDEFKKWGNDEYLDRVTFSTYAGLHKVPDIRGHFNCVILDEAHHVTPRVQDLLTYITYDKIIMLSAIVKRDLKYDLIGRILRHKNPVIVIPFYKGTREEELVAKMLEDYNPQLIHTVENITDIKI